MYRAAQIRLGIVSTYVPRRCGLATYTADLREALGGGDIEPVVIAIDRDGLNYGDEVITVVSQDRISSYETAADTIAAAGVDAVLIQHEYGIFGGPNGAYVLHLARALTRRAIPYLVTLHTQLSQPSPGRPPRWPPCVPAPPGSPCSPRPPAGWRSGPVSPPATS
jgi:hypothetical protein